MALPVVGKRYRVDASRKGRFVGRCVSAHGAFWEFELESNVQGMNRDWAIGDVLAVRAVFVERLEEIPLGAQG